MARRRPSAVPTRRNDAACPAVSLAMTGFRDRGTQWVVLSAATEHSWCGEGHGGTGSSRVARTRAIQPLLTLLCEPLTQRAHGMRMRHCDPLVWTPFLIERHRPSRGGRRGLLGRGPRVHAHAGGVCGGAGSLLDPRPPAPLCMRLAGAGDAPPLMGGGTVAGGTG